ncbi:hypothetical protein AWH56_002945 [Anaerobacillus isosaccharinicus]|uniref:Cysteine-rich CPCC domain-containing protein n=1 Tax=Anaerobacillus isosaccharinicus TaxID=1532552 RepID=A0A1S2M7C5_9BACI|nr:hypothetical protein [Anaerobacillus isosaccharinicus]MBA5585000.1 hypothetical protein [Anaerobacillus isosaccharinicus]QOY36647.1 hypothetical protein AWH56_002945 [Anaerobacillus isosaccharinicus]
MSYICPICGYDKLEEIPYDKEGNPSYEICSCCGFEFGYDDHSEGKTFAEYRQLWIENDCKWFNEDERPKNWSLKQQLVNINIFL